MALPDYPVGVFAKTIEDAELYQELVDQVVSAALSAVWSSIDKTGSALTDLDNRALTDLTSRDHEDLTNIGEADPTSSDATRDKHVSNNDLKLAVDHSSATSGVHGATGDLVGTGDTATTSTAGVVLEATASTDASASSVSVTSADVSTAPGAYNATWGGEVETLANELKADLNQLVTDVNTIKDSLNDLKAKLRTSGALST